MKKLFAVALCCCLCCFALVAVAHPGRTDSNGGHYNRSTGEYHYHHGQPEHQHYNGVCPYDFAQGESRSGSGNGGGGVTYDGKAFTGKPAPEATTRTVSVSAMNNTPPVTTLQCLGIVMWFALMYYACKPVTAIINSKVDVDVTKSEGMATMAYGAMMGNLYFAHYAFALPATITVIKGWMLVQRAKSATID